MIVLFVLFYQLINDIFKNFSEYAHNFTANTFVHRSMALIQWYLPERRFTYPTLRNAKRM